MLIWLIASIATVAVCIWHRQTWLGVLLGVLSLGGPVAIAIAIGYAFDRHDGSMAPGMLAVLYGGIAAPLVAVGLLIVALVKIARDTARAVFHGAAGDGDTPEVVAPWLREMRGQRERDTRGQ